MAPKASTGRTWLASSKITKSKLAEPGGRYLAMESGAHHEDGLDALDGRSSFDHEFADRQVIPLLLELAHEDSHLAAGRTGGQPVVVFGGDVDPVPPRTSLVQLAEPNDPSAVFGAVELAQRCSFPAGQIEPRRVAGVLEDVY